MRKLLIVSAGLVLSGALLYFSGFTESFVWAFEGHPGLPGCDSAHGEADAERAIDNAPFAKTSSISIVSLADPKQVSLKAGKIECSATVILNSSTRGIMNYSFNTDPALASGRYYVQASLDLPSFKPYP